MFEQGDDLDFQTPEVQPESESSNRTFIIVAGIMAGIILISIICMAVYFLVIAPGQQEKRAAEQATVEAYNQQLQQAMTQTAEAALWTSTVQPSPESSPTATKTPVLAVETTTQTVEIDPLTATMAFLQTQVAMAQGSPTVTVTGTIIAMPQGGFAEAMGIPALIITAVVLVVVILLARRLRKAPSS